MFQCTARSSDDLMSSNGDLEAAVEDMNPVRIWFCDYLTTDFVSRVLRFNSLEQFDHFLLSLNPKDLGSSRSLACRNVTYFIVLFDYEMHSVASVIAYNSSVSCLPRLRQRVSSLTSHECFRTTKDCVLQVSVSHTWRKL